MSQLIDMLGQLIDMLGQLIDVLGQLIDPLSVFFVLSRVFLSYIVLMFPNGSTWFTTFICYVTFYHDLKRSECILEQTWEAVDSITKYMGDLEESPLRPKEMKAENQLELKITWMFFKGENKKLYVSQRFIGQLDDEFLVEAPNPVFWLNRQLIELHGINLVQLMIEKENNTERWNIIKTCYIFP